MIAVVVLAAVLGLLFVSAGVWYFVIRSRSALAHTKSQVDQESELFPVGTTSDTYAGMWTAAEETTKEMLKSCNIRV